MEETKRVFISLSIPSEIKDKIFTVLRPIQGIEWHPKENFHITLKFLGDVDERQEKILKSLLEFLSKHFESIPISFYGFKFADNRLRLMVRPDEKLDLLYKTVVRNLKQIGLFKEDRLTFEAHVTLGRVVALAYVDTSLIKDFSSLNFTANTLTLYQTLRGESAAIFTPLVQVVLLDKK